MMLDYYTDALTCKQNLICFVELILTTDGSEGGRGINAEGPISTDNGSQPMYRLGSIKMVKHMENVNLKSKNNSIE